MHLVGGLTGYFHQPEDDFIAVLGSFQRQHTHATVIETQQGEFLAEGARVLCALKCDERLVEAMRLPVRFRLAPVPRMAGQPVNELMAAEVLRSLIVVGHASTEAR